MSVESGTGYVLAWAVFISFCAAGGVVIVIDLEGDIQVSILQEALIN